MYTARIANIKYIPQDGSTAESLKWQNIFMGTYENQTWWKIDFQIDAPDSILSFIRGLHVSSEWRSLANLRNEYYRLYTDLEYTLNVENGAFYSCVLCNDVNATKEQLYAEMVADEIRVWFSFTPIRFRGPWHPCSSFIQ